ncbi:hypothetical protein Tco_0987065, partial [Tanacetum coccineum]
MVGGHDFHEIEEVLQEDREKAAFNCQGTNKKEIKTMGGEMQRTLGIKQKTMGGDLENRRILKLCDIEDALVYDRFLKVERMYAVPPLMIGNYMPPRPDKEIDDSMFTYGPKQSNTSESNANTNDFDSCESNTSVETLEFMPKPVVIEPKVVSQPKVWSDAPIIEEYESDSDDEYV